jgi:hypothetical protein
MFGFLKKLFGGDTETNKAAGVQVEQAPVVDAKVEAANQAPYKVETPVFLTPEAVPVVVAEEAPVVVAEVAKKAPAKKKPQAAKPKAEKPAQKPAAITAPKKSGRKPKSKA